MNIFRDVREDFTVMKNNRCYKQGTLRGKEGRLEM